jgi:hypothetical protein
MQEIRCPALPGGIFYLLKSLYQPRLWALAPIYAHLTGHTSEVSITRSQACFDTAGLPSQSQRY